MTSRASIALEMPALLEILQRYVASPLGMTQLESATAQGPLASAAAAKASLAEVAEAMEWIRAAASPDQRNLTPLPSFFGLQDCRPYADRMETDGAAPTEPVPFDAAAARTEAIMPPCRSQSVNGNPGLQSLSQPRSGLSTQ